MTLFALLLQDVDIVFRPSLEINESGGFLDTMDMLLLDIYRQSTQVDRLSKHANKGDYMVGDSLNTYGISHALISANSNYSRVFVWR